MRLNLSRIIDPTEAVLANEIERLKAAEQERPAMREKSNLTSCQPVVEPFPTLTQNDERNGYELRFTGPIPKALSNELLLNRWRYIKSLNDPRWYTRRTPASLNFAKELIRKYNGLDHLDSNCPAVNEIILQPSPRLRQMLGLQIA
jgi:hypothetical protein